MVFTDYLIPVVWLLAALSPVFLLVYIRTRRPPLLWLGFLSGIPILLYTLYFVGTIIWDAF